MATKTTQEKSQFQKPSSLRWTWESPGGGYRNEIDHIIVSERFSRTVVDVAEILYGITASPFSGEVFVHPELTEHLRVCTRKAQSSETTKRCLPPETPKLIRQRGAGRATGNHDLTF
ncbi:hypothetical protein RB195_022724 [Necator americanus]|uniref:Uncharacterized protein n=1 Tax=Necator americanus TaxID=51031 RepID=A0ABR1EGE0_NECAM